MVFGLALGMRARLHLAYRNGARSACAHFGAVMRSAGMLRKLAQESACGRRVVVAADVHRRAAENGFQEAAGLGMRVEVPASVVARARGVAHVEVGHEIAYARHVKMLFVRLLVAIADLARAVKGEARAAVLREEPHLLARQQRRAIDQVTEREITRTALEASVNRHLDRHRLAPVVNRHYRVVQLPVMEIEQITRAVIT